LTENCLLLIFSATAANTLATAFYQILGTLYLTLKCITCEYVNGNLIYNWNQPTRLVSLKHGHTDGTAKQDSPNYQNVIEQHTIIIYMV